MQQYWANIDGKQYGPVTKDELLGIGLTKKSYIWHEGLDEWIKVEDCDELADLFPGNEPPVIPSESPAGVLADAPSEDLETGENRGEEDADSDDAAEPVPPQLPQQPQFTQPQNTASPMQQDEPCPPTYLVWGIITTLLCCQIFGIISIVYGAQVSSKYNQGDIEGAKKYSERAALWSILAIVAGLVTMPFIVAIQMMNALI